MMKCDSNKQGVPSNKKQRHHTICPIQVSRFLQNVRRWPYFIGKNQAFWIVRSQAIPHKSVVWALLQPMYWFTLGKGKVRLTCEKWSKLWKNCWKLKKRKNRIFTCATIRKKIQNPKTTFNEFWSLLFLCAYLVRQ